MRRLVLNILIASVMFGCGVNAAVSYSQSGNQASQQSPEAKAKIEEADLIVQAEVPIGSTWSQVQKFLMRRKLVYGEYLNSPKRVKRHPDFKLLNLPNKKQLVHGCVCTLIFGGMDEPEDPYNIWVTVYFDESNVVIGHTITSKEGNDSAL